MRRSSEGVDARRGRGLRSERRSSRAPTTRPAATGEDRRVLAERVARTCRGDGRGATRPPSRALRVTSRQPIGPETTCPGTRARRLPSRAIDDVESERLQATGAGSRDDPVLDDSKRHAPAVERQDEIASEGGRIARAPDLRAELIGRDLGDVERVPDVDVAAGDLDAGVAIDREVAERVRARRRRRREQSGDDAAERNQGKCDAAPHRTGSHYASKRFVEAGARPAPTMNVRPTCPSCCRSPTADPRCTGRIRAGSGRRR